MQGGQVHGQCPGKPLERLKRGTDGRILYFRRKIALAAVRKMGGREGGNMGAGTQSGRAPGSSRRAGRNEETRWEATRHPNPLLLLRSRHPSTPALKLLVPKNLDREPNPQTRGKSKQSRGPNRRSFRIDVLFFQSTPFMGST